MDTTKPRIVTLALASLVALAGCAGGGLQDHEIEREIPAAEMDQFLDGRPPALAEYYRARLAQGDRNLVLNEARIGILALEAGHLDLAREALEKAALNIETIYADNANAEQARSNFVKENVKDFKGEPYERAMVFYYLGVTYLASGDFENARASFEAGQFQDTLAAEESYKADFALLSYLSGWASRCSGSDHMAIGSFEEARSHRVDLQLPAAEHDTLVLLETGDAPVKWAEGDHDELLKVHAGSDPGLRTAVYDAGSTTVPMVLASDSYFQASTRGGREVDAVLAGKAQFKDGLDAAGNVMVTAGAATAAMGAYSGDRGMAGAGLAFMLIGAIAQSAAEASQPEADIRYLDLLPGTVLLTTTTTTGRQGGPVHGLNAEVAHAFGNETCRLIWARDRAQLGKAPARAPNSSNLSF